MSTFQSRQRSVQRVQYALAVDEALVLRLPGSIPAPAKGLRDKIPESISSGLYLRSACSADTLTSMHERLHI